MIDFLRKNFTVFTSLLTASFFFGNAAMSIAYVIFLLTGLTMVNSNFQIKEIIKDRVMMTMMLFFVVNLISLLFSVENPKEIIKIEKLLPFLLFPIIFFNISNNLKKVLPQIKMVFVLAASTNLAVNLLYALYRYLKTSNSIYLTYNHLSEPFGIQPIYLSVFYLLAILFIIDRLQLKKKFNWSCIIMGISLFVGIILLSSRTSTAITLILLTVRLFMFIKKKRNFFLLVLSALTIGSILIFTVPTLKNRVLNFEGDISTYSGTSLRFKIWDNVMVVSKEALVLGHGYNISQQKLMAQYEKVNFRRALLGKLNAHNQYLQSLMDAGILGLLSLLFILILHFNLCRGNIVYLFFAITMAMSLLTESFFSRQYGVLFFVFFYLLFYKTSINGTGKA